jgi:DNA replication and repair protein RecF
MLNIDFHEGTNILFGNNAQGKTNILEAIYVCATTKSHRTSVDKELIKFNFDEAHIKMNILKNENSIRIDTHIKNSKNKGIAVNGIPIKKSSELFGLVNIIFFSPQDLNLIKDGPKERRRFLDLELCQLDKLYFYNLQQYNKALIQRNNLLKQIDFKKELINTLDIWDIQLLKYGKEIINQRRLFVNRINEIVFDIHNNITGNNERINIEYEPNVLEDNYEIKLKENRDKDLKFKNTSVGIHRDDMIIEINNIDIRKYGSQGQQRTAALSLKLAEIEIVKEIIDDTPILLLDDVMSELDSSRQNHLLNSIRNIQTIVTCTGLDEFIENRVNIDKLYLVKDSKVTIENEL